MEVVANVKDVDTPEQSVIIRLALEANNSDHNLVRNQIMGLKNQPEFEKMDSITVMDSATADTAAQASKALSKSVVTGVSTNARKFEPAFKDKNNVFDTATVEGLSLAAPRIKGEQGSLSLGDQELGAEIQFELISFNHRWAIGTGENDKESKDFFRISYDNETLSGDGTRISDYLDALRAQGFKRAKKSPYMDLWGFVVWSSKTGAIPVDERQLACLQCSQTSMGAFTAFSTTRGLLEQQGVTKPIDVIEVHAEKQSNKNGDKYTNFSFFVPKAK